MPMSTYQAYGDKGEKEVISLIKCPNCQKSLMSLPKGYPLFDVQCVACTFRAQIKSSSSDPDKFPSVRGGGWNILNMAWKAGSLIPPLIVNYKWIKEGKSQQEIRFYPFVQKENLTKRLAKITKKGKEDKRLYWMVSYKLKYLPYFKIF
jgi:hypothetical protein